MTIQLLKTSRILTPKLLLRPWLTTDAEAYHRVLGDPRVGQWLGQPSGFTPIQTQQWIRGMQFWWERHSFGPWAVVTRSSGELIGHCGLKFAEESSDIELMYALRPDMWHQGLATEAASFCCQWAFAHLNTESLVALTHRHNLASQHLLERLNFRFERCIELNHQPHAFYSLTPENSNPQYPLTQTES
jgi:ribosomal-protein-alanine N-acetyltransferase